MPPARGIGSAWTFLLEGISTSRSFPANRATKGVTIKESSKERQNMDMSVDIGGVLPVAAVICPRLNRRTKAFNGASISYKLCEVIIRQVGSNQ